MQRTRKRVMEAHSNVLLCEQQKGKPRKVTLGQRDSKQEGGERTRGAALRALNLFLTEVMANPTHPSCRVIRETTPNRKRYCPDFFV